MQGDDRDGGCRSTDVEYPHGHAEDEFPVVNSIMYIPPGLHEMSLLPSSSTAPAGVNNCGAEPSRSPAADAHHVAPQLHLFQALQQHSIHYNPYRRGQHMHHNLNLPQSPAFSNHHHQIQHQEFNEQPRNSTQELKHIQQNHHLHGSFPNVLFADASLGSHQNQHRDQQQQYPLPHGGAAHQADDADMASPKHNLASPIVHGQQPPEQKQEQLHHRQEQQQQQQQDGVNATSMQASATNESQDDSKETIKDDIEKVHTSQKDRELEGVNQKAFTGTTTSSNRWPRQETLALLKIRSDMDAMFRDSNPKGPLWEMVSRKLAEMGFSRSAKKCKEKFENVHKYYKRTREEKKLTQGIGGGSAGGKKNYRFFSELEALYAGKSNSRTALVAASAAPPLIMSRNGSNDLMVGNSTTSTHVANPMLQPLPVNHSLVISYVEASTKSDNRGQLCPLQVQLLPPSLQPQPHAQPIAADDPGDLQNHLLKSPERAWDTPQRCNGGLNISDNSSSDATTSSGPQSDSDEEDDTRDAPKEQVNQTAAPCATTTTTGSQTNGRKRKRKRKRKHGTASMRKYVQLFDSLIKKVLHKQEQMQQRFLEALQRRDQDRMVREEAWRRQEMVRMSREQDIRAQEHALSASRDATLVAFLQKFSGQTIALPQPVISSMTPDPTPVAPPPLPPSAVPMPVALSMNVPTSFDHLQYDDHERDSFYDSSKRWPKPEVIALIKLRISLEHRFHEPGSKAALWEEISKALSLQGYSRTAKRCKEKWENINKYFKKAKESKKLRSENAKTCPYFHELDALYKGGVLGSLEDKPTQLLLTQRGENEVQRQPPQSQQQANGSDTSGGEDSGQTQDGDSLDIRLGSGCDDTCGGISSNDSAVHLFMGQDKAGGKVSASNSKASAPMGVDGTSKLSMPTAALGAVASLITLDAGSSIKSSGKVADYMGIELVGPPVEQAPGKGTAV